nr:sulfotransferase [Wenzhouxiangella sp. XN79A]
MVNLFIVGAAKAGTSSLWAALRGHPDIFAPADELQKEPSFFTPIASGRGTYWYESLFREGRDRAYRMDSSTAYLATPESAAAIHDYNPHARIIIVLRNPGSRAYSLYLWMVAEGYEWAPSFEAALDLEDTRAANPQDRKSMPQYFWNYMYRRSGLYADQVQRFTKLFAQNVLLVNFHELVARPAVELARIQEFLRVERAALTLERENPSMQVISPRLSFAARQVQQKLSSRLPARFGQTKRARDILLSLCATNRRPPPMQPATRVALDAYFAEDLAQLYERYDVDLRQTKSLQDGPGASRDKARGHMK